MPIFWDLLGFVVVTRVEQGSGSIGPLSANVQPKENRAAGASLIASEVARATLSPVAFSRKRKVPELSVIERKRHKPSWTPSPFLPWITFGL